MQNLRRNNKDFAKPSKTFKKNNEVIFKLKDCADGGFSTVNDLRTRLQKTMKDLELKIEKAQSLKDSWQNRQGGAS